MEIEKTPVIYLGKEKEPSPVHLLKAGGLDCVYVDGAIRHVRAGGKEIIRMIYPAVRDHNWGTVPVKVSQEEIREEEDSFSIRYEGKYCESPIEYHSHVHLSGNADNTLTFSMQGKALSNFKKNRIGLNILHPISECAGRECRVVTHAGEEYTAVFPLMVSPLQPMKNIRSLAWTLEGNIQVFMGFSGEVFEMEDQRNWTDASYKTYCTPLDLPFPAAVEEGETLKQEVYLKIQLPGMETGQYEALRIGMAEQEDLHEFPQIGLARSSENDPIHPADMQWIKNAGFRHYRLDLHLDHEGWPEILSSGAEEAAGMGLDIELGLFFGNDVESQLARLLTETGGIKSRVTRVLVFNREQNSDEGLCSVVIPPLQKEFSKAG